MKNTSKQYEKKLKGKDAKIKELAEALEGFLSGTTVEFSELNGFRNARDKAEKALSKHKEQ